MKMAKASKADLDMALELTMALDSLTCRWGAMMPEKIERASENGERFDRDDSEQCKRVVAYLLDLAASASLMRVVFGMSVLLDPCNKVVDPDADTLERHPDFAEAPQ